LDLREESRVNFLFSSIFWEKRVILVVIESNDYVIIWWD
jgi:hypothetical protein